MTWLGSVITAIITNLLSKKSELDFKRHEQKAGRYRSILLYMDVYFEPKNIKFLSSRQPDISSQEDVIEYLKAEYHEMVLYSSREVLLAVKKFIYKPSREHFLGAVLEMRADLWIRKRDIRIKDIWIDSFKKV